MRLGLQLPSFSYPGGPAAIRSTLTEIGQAAEAAGLASLWVMDHWFQLPEDTGWGGPEEPMLEAYTTLGFLAQATTGSPSARSSPASSSGPGALIKTATTLDVLAGGRTYLGLGAGWYEREAHGLGFPFPPRPSGSNASRRRSGSRTGCSPAIGRRSTAATTASPSRSTCPLPCRGRGRGSWSAATGRAGRWAWSPATATPATCWTPIRARAAGSSTSIRGCARRSAATPAEVETTSLLEADLRPGRGCARPISSNGAPRAGAPKASSTDRQPSRSPSARIRSRRLGREVLPEIDGLGSPPDVRLIRRPVGPHLSRPDGPGRRSTALHVRAPCPTRSTLAAYLDAAVPRR